MECGGATSDQLSCDEVGIFHIVSILVGRVRKMGDWSGKVTRESLADATESFLLI